MIEEKDPSKFNVIFSEGGKSKDLFDKTSAKQKFYIAAISPEFLKSPGSLEELYNASSIGLEMYGFILSGVTLPKIIRLIKWKKLTYYEDAITMTNEIKKLLVELQARFK